MTTLQFSCPAALLARGLATQEQRPADLPALRALFRHQRWSEFAMLPWDDAAKAALIDQQFDAQQRHYASAYPQLLLLVLIEQEQVVGRLYLGRREAGDLCLLDILLSPHHQGRGIGTALISAVLDKARSTGQRVLLEVDKRNPAAGLYRRLGFHAIADTGVGWCMVWSVAAVPG